MATSHRPRQRDPHAWIRGKLVDAHEDLTELPELLHRLYHGALPPRGSTLDPRAPIRSSSASPAPAPGDPKGYDTYRWAADQLCHAMKLLEPDWHPPGWYRASAPSPHDVGQVARALRAYLTTSAPQHYGRSVLVRVLATVGKVRINVGHAAGATGQPPPPDCDTPGCTGHREHGTRCWRCVNFKRTHGDYPDIARSVG